MRIFFGVGEGGGGVFPQQLGIYVWQSFSNNWGFIFGTAPTTIKEFISGRVSPTIEDLLLITKHYRHGSSALIMGK